jgi:very-short-patch-repair endonuclease/DNA polymerase III delta prime subunit
MSFLPGADEDDALDHEAHSTGLAQPEEDAACDESLHARHIDSRLQTRLPSERLQSRLLAMYYDSQTYVQEQGVSILYLAAGFLKWYEAPSSDNARYAPLLLVPVDLDRASAASRFHVRFRDEDIATNLSLQAKLKGEFGIKLPDIPDSDDFSPTDYFESVRQAIVEQQRWEVRSNDMVLWFFSFAKYLMYRDLDPGTWPEHCPLESNAILSALLRDGVTAEPGVCGEHEKIDPLIPPAQATHVTDADSSQAIVIEEVRRGRHLVVQGPPGTGKSQTITNLIATAVKEGKRVLFVAEKMAALDVVYSRLDRLGLTAMCLELHSNKANKKTLLEDLSRTLNLGRPKNGNSAGQVEALGAAISRLNRHAEMMNTTLEPAGVTPYEIIGHLSSLYGRGIAATNLPLVEPESWTNEDFDERCRAMDDLQIYLKDIGNPVFHRWRGVTRTDPILHAELADLLAEISATKESLLVTLATAARFAASVGLSRESCANLKDVEQLAKLCVHIARAPALDRRHILHPAWDGRIGAITQIVANGRVVADSGFGEQLRGVEELRAHQERVGDPREHPFRGVRRLDELSPDEVRQLGQRFFDAVEALRRIVDSSTQLRQSLALSDLGDLTLRGAQQMVDLAARVLSAPPMDRSHICDPVWANDWGRVRDLAQRGETFSTHRDELRDTVLSFSCQIDLASTRRNLARFAGSFFRWFRKEYREACAQFRGVLKDKPPRQLAERLRVLDGLIAIQTGSKELDEDPSTTRLGREAFGVEWRGSESDWSRLAAILQWDVDCTSAKLPGDHRQILSTLGNPEALGPTVSRLSATLQEANQRLSEILTLLSVDVKQTFGVDAVALVPAGLLLDRLRLWCERPDALAEWIGYQRCWRRIQGLGLGELFFQLQEGRMSVAEAVDHLQARFHQALFRKVASQFPATTTPLSASPDIRPDGFREVAQLGHDAFGTSWKGLDSDWSNLGAVLQWDQKCREARLLWNHREMLACVDEPAIVTESLKALSEHFKPSFNRLKHIVGVLAFDLADAFGADSLLSVPIQDLIDRLNSWLEDPEALSKWASYLVRRKRLEGAGLGPIVQKVHHGEILMGEAVDRLKVAYYQALVRMAFRVFPELAEFDGLSHEQLVRQFRKLDESRIESARHEVAAAHYDAIPRGVAGEMAVVRREIEKRKRHKSIRQLIREAGTAIQSIKPVFMMSPISVAQYLEPGGVSFDLLIFDEASQVSPVDALGAMARTKQVVVVGDDKQLPPTRFFNKMVDEDLSADYDEQDAKAGDLESILGLCLAQGVPKRTLRWHYRSRHHSLIAVSNREFYENLLYVVPSPTTITAMHGLHFRLIKDGVFDRGGSAANSIEAQAIAQAVIDHARNFPQKTLGVGAFSAAQRDAIRDELEVLQRQHVELAGFFSTGKVEPFFVKNLENIQGDERDVIFISVGYARDRSGFMSMNFGPLSNEGGERRLNVLISRARERCEVFSSITADDIDLQRAKSRGAAAFKAFLRYAATGELDCPKPKERDYDSGFERQVSRSVEALGYEVHCQVGTAGFVIDLAVVDPVSPGRYLLGVECDGASYHSSRSARERDRLREMVLRDRGWRIHRVWSTDWFNRPKEQLQKIVTAIEQARIEEHVDAPELDVGPGGEIEREKPTADPAGDGSPCWISSYVEASFDVPSRTPIHETELSVLADIVAKVVEIEGPIHREEIARRITSLWGQQRTGARISDAVSKAIDVAVRAKALSARSDFISVREQGTSRVRDRSKVSSQALRKAEMLPPQELSAAIVHLVAKEVGISCDEVQVGVSRALGFRATSEKLSRAVADVLAAVVKEGSLLVRDGKLYPP